MYKIINDNYKKARGGKSHILDVCCEGCGAHLTYYQKDGPGLLKRMYVDRFIDTLPAGNDLVCNSCGRVLGNLIKKENEIVNTNINDRQNYLTASVWVSFGLAILYLVLLVGISLWLNSILKLIKNK